MRGSSVVERDRIRVIVGLGGTDRGLSGIGRFVGRSLPALAEVVRAAGGTLVLMGTDSELALYAAHDGAEIVRVRETPHAAVSALWYLSRAEGHARNARGDVLLLPAANRRVAWSRQLPIVAVVHDLAQLHVPDKYDALRTAYATRLLPLALRRARVLAAVSDSTRRDLARATGRTHDTIRLVPNGVDTEVFAPAAPNCERVRRARLAWGLERPYLLYPARLEHPGKNHDRLLRAFASSTLRESHQLAFTGGDWGASARIRSAIALLGLGAAVRMLGYVDEDSLAALVAGAEAVLAVGLHEGFGLPALEGLAAGRPVLVSRTGAMTEFAAPLAVLCDPCDEASIRSGLERVALDEGLRERMAREGPAHAARWSWRATALALFDACRSATA